MFYKCIFYNTSIANIGNGIEVIVLPAKISAICEKALPLLNSLSSQTLNYYIIIMKFAKDCKD